LFTLQKLCDRTAVSDAVQPDVLITNLSLPGMTGLELIQRIKGTRQLKDIPIIAIDNSRTFRPSDVIDAGAGGDPAQTSKSCVTDEDVDANLRDTSA